MPASSHAFWRGLAARPALRLAALLSGGILLAREIQLPATMWYVLLSAGAILTILVFFVEGRRRAAAPHGFSSGDTLIHGLIVLSGAALFALTEQDHRTNLLEPPFPDYPVRASGWVVTPPQPTRNGFSFVLGADSIIAPHWTERESREVMVYVRSKAGVPSPSAGVRIRLEGTLERFPRPRNPGENDYGATLGLMGISGILRGTGIIIDSSATGSTIRGRIGSVQQMLYGWIDDLHPGEHGSFVKGIILGYRADLPEDLKEAFMVTGTVHILAVSGSNVALIGLIVMVCSGFLRIPRWARAALTIAGMIFYMLVTGGGPSITRATIMGIVVVLLLFVSRRGDVLQSLGLSACLLLFIDPRNLFDAGFLLSFASVAWIVTGNGVVEDVIRRLPEEVRESYVLRSAIQLCGISLLAQLGTIPISAATFGQISLISVLANLLVVPLSAVVLLLGVAELSFYWFVPILSSLYASANGLIIDMLLGFVRLAAAVPYASVTLRISGLIEGLLVYSVFAGIVWFTRPVIRKAAVMTCLICVNIIVWGKVVNGPARSLDWIAADVGQGDAHVLRTPSGKIILVDAAPSQRIAETVLLPLLHSLNVAHIDRLILTHPHRDHTAGLNMLLDRLPVRTLVVSDSAAVPRGAQSRLNRTGTAVEVVRAGDVISFDEYVRGYVLHPRIVRPWAGWNDNSIVLKVVHGNDRVLFTGDLEAEGEEEMLSVFGSFVESGLLKVGHHGSKTSTTGSFVAYVDPRAAVIPVGWKNRFDHPSPGTVLRLQELGVEVEATSEVGAVWWRSGGLGWSKVEWRNGQW